MTKNCAESYDKDYCKEFGSLKSSLINFDVMQILTGVRSWDVGISDLSL